MSKDNPTPSRANATRFKHPWTGAEDQFLRNNYGKLSIDEIATKLNRTFLGTYAHARALGMTGKNRPAQVVWTEEQIAYLKEHYKTTSKPELCEKLNKGSNGLYFKALELGLVRKMYTIQKEKQTRCAIVLAESDKEFARELGEGCVSDGIRIALREMAKRKAA
jgi:hypothetical protein